MSASAASRGRRTSGGPLKGIILAGGSGTRLDPLTQVTNKHLLPVYDRPMIRFAIDHLVSAGITEALLVTGAEHLSTFRGLLGDGAALGLARLEYASQTRAGGIAEALGLAEAFAAGDPLAVLLGDNIFEHTIAPSAERFRREPHGARLLLARVADPTPYGVAVLEGQRLVRVVEKPKVPPSPYIVTGMYFFDARAFDFARTLRPSGRGELEITDVVNRYVELGEVRYDIVEGYWVDCGESFDALLRAANLVATKGTNKVAASA